jgi:hypothetical protein
MGFMGFTAAMIHIIVFWVISCSLEMGTNLSEEHSTFIVRLEAKMKATVPPKEWDTPSRLTHLLYNKDDHNMNGKSYQYVTFRCF